MTPIWIQGKNLPLTMNIYIVDVIIECKNVDEFHENLRDYNFMCYSKTLAYTIVCILQHSFILEWKPEVWSCNLWFTHVSMMLKPLNPPLFSP